MSEMRAVTGPWQYSARLEDGHVVLRLERERTTFVRETITYGELAGTIGHRPVQGTDEAEFLLSEGEAEVLWQQLGRALGRSWG